jgi:4-amino-4-deoxy-L-arabinose transferase-like glycosyltransferase
MFACIVWILVIFNQAYFQGIFEVSEAREGVVVNEIKNYGTWILPLRHGEVVPSKPPLFHWVAAALSPHSEFLSQFSLRLPSLLASILCFYIIFRFLNKSHPDSAFDAVLILSTMYGFFQMSLDGRVDMLFTFLFLFNVLIINRILLNTENNVPGNNIPSFKEKLFLGIIIGLSILSRGPLGLVLTLICLFSGLIILKQFGNLKSWFIKDKFLFLLTPIVISAPWYLASKFLGKPELISRQLVFENFSRFVGSDKIPSKPLWFYFQHLPFQLSAWILVLGFAGLFYLKDKNNEQKKFSKNTIKLFLIQTAAILLFLSLASGKRGAYLLQILPFISIILSLLLMEVRKTFDYDNSKFFFGIQKYILGFSYLLVFLFLIQILLKILPLSFISFFTQAYYFKALKELTWFALIIPLITLPILVLYLRRLVNNKNLKLVPAIWLISMETYLAVAGFFFLVKGESHSLKAFAQEIQAKVNDQELTLIKKREDESFDSFLFYYGKRVKLAPLENYELENGFYLSRKSWFENQSAEKLEDYETIFEGKRLADKEIKTIVLFNSSSLHQDYE